MSSSQSDEEFSIKRYFVPLTTFKAIHWIIVIGLIVFANMLFNGFVWDDRSFILENTEIHSFDITKIFGQNYFNLSQYYRPVPAFYFSTLYVFFKDIAFFYHFFQLALHIVNAVLLFLLFQKFFKKQIAFFLSLIFLVHPMQVESVSYISTTVSPLFFLFGLLALHLYLGAPRRTKNIVIVGVLLLLSLLTKETGFLFLGLIFIYGILIRKKVDYIFTSISLLVVGCYALLRIGIGTVATGLNSELVPITTLSFAERIVNIPAIVFYYVKTFFFPKDLAITQLWVVTAIDINTFYLPLLVSTLFFSVIASMGWYTWKRKKDNFKLFLFFSLWFLLGLVMHLQILPLNMTVADRWFYFPMAGLLGVIGVFLNTVKLKHILANKTNILYVIGLLIILLLATRTMVRNTNWVNGITLYTHDRQIHSNFQIENNLGGEYILLNNYDLAIKHLTLSVEMLPRETTYDNIASLYEKKGDNVKAKEYYAKALNAKHYMPIPQKHILETYERYLVALLITDDFQGAKILAQEALKEYPTSANVWMSLAIAEHNLGSHDQALAAAKRAKAISTNAQTDYVYNQIINKQQIKFLD